MPPVSPELARQLFGRLDAELVPASCRTEEELVAVARDVDAIVGASIGRLLSRRGLAELRRCRIVSLWAGSTDYLDLQAFTDHGICVCFAADACTEEVADHGMALMLALARKLFFFDQVMRERQGHYTPHDDIIEAARPLPRLATLTVGCIGLGRAGLALAERVRPFGMRFLAHDPFVPAGTGQDLGVQLVSRREVLAESDFLHLYVPMKADTFHLIGREELQQMKPTAYVVNASARAQVIDEGALRDALVAGRLAGAALDNLEMKEGAVNPLLGLGNVIVTPHVSHVSDHSYAAMQRRLCEDVVAFFEGRRPALVANPEVLGKARARASG